MVALLVRLFFRRVVALGLETLPVDRGVLLVAWHPNGLVDPALILSSMPGHLVLGARHGLFSWPILGWLMRALGTVPIYRRSDFDDSDDVHLTHRNATSLDALAVEIANGSASALFPEGISHDAPRPMTIKTGAARLYFRARELRDPASPAPVIVPVGLHYDRKRVYRSTALVIFHPALDLPLDLEREDGADPEAVLALTEHIEQALEEASLGLESWELHSLLLRARKLVRAERAHRAQSDPGRTDIVEKVIGMKRIWVGYQHRSQTDADAVDAIQKKISDYDDDLRALGMDDHELDRPPEFLSPKKHLLLLGQLLGVFVLMPPVVLLGYLVNAAPALAIGALSAKLAGLKKDVATLKLLLGLVLFPPTWIGFGLLSAWGSPLSSGASHSQLIFVVTILALAAALGGALSIHYVRLAREVIRAVRVRLTRRRELAAVARLRAERSRLHDLIIGMAEGIELPGSVREDGRVDW